VRFGDPECQVLMMRLNSDLVELLSAACQEKLAGMEIKWHDQTALSVVMAANGYPAVYEKGTVIKGLDKASALDDVMVFHAGTAKNDAGEITAIGGRVLNITALGASVTQAQTQAYQGVDLIDWPQGFSRSDIGWRAVEREAS
jgi:phosphoribosylamine--glycine ligase